MSKIDTSQWKKFLVGDLFEKLRLRSKDHFSKNRDVSRVRSDEFSLPLVNAKHGNNGIMYYARPSDFEGESMTLDVVYNGAVAAGDVYPQPQKTGVLCDAYLIRLKDVHVCPAVLCFLATVLQKTIKHKYGYDEKAVWDKIKKETILLPVCESGEPNWDWMRDFIIKVGKQAKPILPCLTQQQYQIPISIESWKSIPITTLFDIKLPSGDNQEKYLPDGNIPLVSAGKTNNGIVKLIEHGAPGTEIFDGGNLTIDMFGYSFYQPNPFFAVSHGRVIILSPKETIIISQEIGHFLATILTRSFAPKCSYDSLCTKTILENSSIMLPVDKHGIPNLNYMQDYIERISKKQGQKLEAMQAATGA